MPWLRDLVGFQASARPVTGSMAPMPGRDTLAAVEPSVADWPPTYTAGPVMATL